MNVLEIIFVHKIVLTSMVIISVVVDKAIGWTQMDSLVLVRLLILY